MNKKKFENGQILYLVALAFVVLLGFTALAIDGANVYSVRRQNQSVADSAALGGAEAASQLLKTALNAASLACTSTVMGPARAAAETTALAQNITLVDNDLSTGTGVTTTCGTSNGVPYLDIHTVVSSTVKTYFLKVLSGQPSKTSTEAIARVYISSQFAGGNVLVATGTTCDANGGIYALGNGHIYMTNGGAYSRSCFSVTGSSVIFSKDHPITYSGQGTKSFYVGSQIEYTVGNGLLFDGNAPVFIETDSDLAVDSGVSYQLWSTYTPNPVIPLSKWPLPAAPQVTALTIDPMVTQACTGPTQTPSINGATTISPGTYPNGIQASYDTLTLQPGVYCIGAGKDVNFNGANVTANRTVIYFMGAGNFNAASYGSTGISMDKSSIYLNNGNFSISNGIMTANYITIYIKKGNFSLSNGAHGVVLNAPGCNTSACGVGPSIPGVLLLMDPGYSHTITVANGSAPGHQLNGTMYAPTALADFSGGTNTTTFDVQLIAQRIAVENGAYLVMDTTNATLYSQGSTTIQLLK